MSALIAMALSALPAQAPPQIGGSFATFVFVAEGPSATTEYFDFDGTFYELSYGTSMPTGFVYYPSSKGTYSYQLVAGSSNQASLVLNYDTGRARNVPLTFETPTSALSNFSFPTVNFFPAAGGSQVLNVSNRARLRPGDTFISGFVIGGTAVRPVLIRAVGPSLAVFGVSPVAQSPQFSLFYGSISEAFGASSPWNVQNNTELNGLAGPVPYDAQALSWLFSFTGAFPLNQDANEQVFFGFLSPNAYTVQTTNPFATGSGGWALTEVYIFPNSADISVGVPASGSVHIGREAVQDSKHKARK